VVKVSYHYDAYGNMVIKGGNMTNKEYILDCLVDGSEAKTQIVEFFEFVKVDITSKELDGLIEEMFRENLITIDGDFVNEFGEKSYAMTTKGRMLWQSIVQNEND
jgi:hypothetical protein